MEAQDWQEYLSFDGTMKEKWRIGDYTLYVGLDRRGYYSAVECGDDMVWNELRSWRHGTLDDAKSCAIERYEEHRRGLL